MRSSFSRTLLFLLPVFLLLSACGLQDQQPQEIETVNEAVAVSSETDDYQPATVETPAHLDIALEYEGTTEVGDNRGPEVKAFLASVGLDEGYPYCAAFVSYSLDQAPNVEKPKVRSALAQDFITNSSIEAKDVLRGSDTAPPGAVIVWKKGSTINGHAGFAIHWDGASGETIEANTSPGAGSQYDGDGVYRRERTIQPGNYFRITHFTPVTYG